jgi:2-keto-3-deoxy-6-phosphogluconate aldolase
MRKVNTELIPVIHMVNEDQVLTNVETCLSCGIKKVFIINHQTTSEELIKCAKKIKEVYPSRKNKKWRSHIPGR